MPVWSKERTGLRPSPEKVDYRYRLSAGKNGKLHCYCASQTVLKGDTEDCPISQVSAASIEAVVIDQRRVLLQSPEVIVATLRTAEPRIEELSERSVGEELERLYPLWEELFPAEQARIVQRIDLKRSSCNCEHRGWGMQVNPLRPWYLCMQA